MTIDELIAHSRLLPTIPHVVQDMLTSLDDEEVTLDEIAHKMAADPALTAKLLRMTNSAFFHVSRTVNSVDEAVAMLGFEAVRSRIVSYGIAGMFREIPGLNLKKLWRYNLYTAGVARHIARAVGVNPELAFTTAMLHTVGLLVMHAAMPRKLQMLEQTVSWSDLHCLVAEHELLGFNHLEAAAELATHWRLPQPMVSALRCAGEPLVCLEFSPLAGVLHLAMWRARCHINQMTPSDIESQMPTAAAASLGMEPAVLLKDLPSTEELLGDLGELDD
jgi:HD-like signal output (HDOD) protein